MPNSCCLDLLWLEELLLVPCCRFYSALVWWIWLTKRWQVAAKGICVCIQNFLQRVHNLLGHLMVKGVWCYVIEPLMDESVW